MESAVFPPNNKQPKETDKLQQQQQQQQQQQKLPKEAMDSRGATAVGLSPTNAIDRTENVNDYIEELEKLRIEVGLLKVSVKLKIVVYY
jgi:hypothetical protein